MNRRLSIYMWVFRLTSINFLFVFCAGTKSLANSAMNPLHPGSLPNLSNTIRHTFIKLLSFEIDSLFDDVLVMMTLVVLVRNQNLL